MLAECAIENLMCFGRGDFRAYVRVIQYKYLFLSRPYGQALCCTSNTVWWIMQAVEQKLNDTHQLGISRLTNNEGVTFGLWFYYNQPLMRSIDSKMWKVRYTPNIELDRDTRY